MPTNPLEGLKALGEQLRNQIGEELDLDVLRRQEPARPLEELLAELDALPGLESVKEQVRALVAFLRVQARRKEAGLPEVATTQHLAFLGNPTEDLVCRRRTDPIVATQRANIRAILPSQRNKLPAQRHDRQLPPRHQTLLRRMSNDASMCPPCPRTPVHLLPGPYSGGGNCLGPPLTSPSPLAGEGRGGG